MHTYKQTNTNVIFTCTFHKKQLNVTKKKTETNESISTHDHTVMYAHIFYI